MPESKDIVINTGPLLAIIAAQGSLTILNDLYRNVLVPYEVKKKTIQMSTQEIKQLLHESIENIDDGEFLLTVKQIIERKYKPGSPPILTKWQLKRIEASKEQIKNGQTLSNNQADILVEKWLSE